MSDTFNRDEEAALLARDARISARISAKIEALRDLADQLWRDYRNALDEAAAIEAAVREGRWAYLENVLSPEDIESLSACHLTDTTAYLGDA